MGILALGYPSKALVSYLILQIDGIKGGFVQLLGFAFMQETYPVVLLEKKTKRLRKETGNYKLQSALSRGYSHKELFSRAIIRPVRRAF